MSETFEPGGVIMETREDGYPVIYSLLNHLPQASVRQALPWLLVVSWNYDRAVRNGMPPEAENERMIQLEDAIQEPMQRDDFLYRAYGRTGNGKKELVYYIKDRDAFLAAFNQSVAKHPRYPIEITFYEDPEWKDLSELLSNFGFHGLN